MFEWFGRVSYCPHTKVADFAVHLRAGRLMGSACTGCGQRSFPPRADCPACGHDGFAFAEWDGRGTVVTFATVDAAPAGFENEVPFTVGVVDLAGGGRLLAPVGATLADTGIGIGMEVQVVPRLHEDCPQIRVDYTLEAVGTTWVKTDQRGESP